LILGLEVTALGERATDPDQQCKPGNGEVAQNRILKQKHTSTHKFPDCFLPTASPDEPVCEGLLPPKWVPNAAETLPESHDGHFGFCPAKPQLCRGVVKPRRGQAVDCAFPGLGRWPVTG
jgi:hypothetical protein